MVDHDARPVGDDVAGDAAFDHHRLHGLAVLAAVDDGPAALPPVDDRQQPPQPVDGVAPHPRASAVGAYALQRHLDPHRALTARFEDAVGGLTENRDVTVQQIGPVAGDVQ